LFGLIDDLRGGLAALRPGRFPYPRFALALAIGLAGGLLFRKLNLPLPFMLGAMTFCTVAALLKAPVAAPAVIRPPMSAVIGVLLGSGFSPAVVSQLPQWWPAVVGLLLFMLACGATVVFYFRRMGGFDPTTAFFSGMPGGLVEMIELGEERGGNPRIIALVHAARILLIVMTIPFAIQWLEGVSLNRAAGSVSVFDVPFVQELWLVGCGLAGAVLGYALKLPAKMLLGPMLVSAIVHLFGFTDFKPAFELVNAAQLVLGVVIGCRFAGTATRTVMRILALSVGSTIILIFWTVLFAVIFSRLSGHTVSTLILAYSPGGLAEMSLIALAIHAEVAFVATMHIVRILLVMVSAAGIFSLLPSRAD
jgi:membrane AbrB-like protein